MEDFNVSARSSPIVPNPDGSCEWNDKKFETYEKAHEARSLLRAMTFGMIYGKVENGDPNSI